MTEPSLPQPPSTARVMMILARNALLRGMSRFGVSMSAAFWKKAPREGRVATARKSRGRWLAVLVALCFVGNGLNMVNIATQMVARLAHYLDGDALPDALPAAIPDSSRDLELHRYPAPFGEGYWPAPEHEADMALALGMVFLLFNVVEFTVMLGSQNQDLGKVEWHLEWLFTFPVPARALFAAQVCQFTFVRLVGWFFTLPFLTAVFWCAGYRWWGVAIATGVIVYYGLLLAACRTLTETWLRQTLPVAQLKNLQAVVGILGVVLLFPLFSLGLAGDSVAAFFRIVDCLPAALLWNPFSLPLRLTQHDVSAWPVLLALLGYALLFPVAGVYLTERLVRHGLLTASNVYQGRRAGARRDDSGLLRGIVGKELRLLLRDRNFLVQTLIVPVVILGGNLLINPRIWLQLAGDAHHAAAMAFALGAYVLIFSGCFVLAAEGNALWLLYTFPRSLAAMLLRKTALWCVFASLYTLLVLAAAAWQTAASAVNLLFPGALALLGIGIYGPIASAIGILGTDPQEQVVQRRVRVGMIYGYMFLAALYGYALYAPSPWIDLVLIVLLVLLAVALWQKVLEQLPYLLDPTAAPPPRLALADGMLAALVFFVLQGLMQLLMVGGDIRVKLTGIQVLIAYTSAGAIVVAGTLLVYWRKQFADLRAALKIRSAADGPPASMQRALVIGLLAGVVAGGCGAVYLWVLDHVPALRVWKEEMSQTGLRTSGIDGLWLAVLAVFAAPLLEEFIFRALVYQGLRRAIRPAGAVLGSAAIFALIHPPISALPVFILGVVAAISLERAHLLVAPIVAHMIYNATVVAYQLLTSLPG